MGLNTFPPLFTGSYLPQLFLVCGVVLLFCLKQPFTQLPLAWFKGATSQDHPVAFALVMVGQE